MITMKNNKTVALDTAVTLSPEYTELTKHNKLSSFVNSLLIQALNIKEINKDTDKAELERKLMALDTEKAILSNQLDKVKADEDKWLLEHPSVKMWVCGVCKVKNHIDTPRCGGCLMLSRDDKGTLFEEVFLK